MIELSNVEMSFWIWTGMPVDRNRRDGEMEMVTVHLLTIRCCVFFFLRKTDGRGNHIMNLFKFVNFARRIVAYIFRMHSNFALKYLHAENILRKIHPS